MGEPIPAHPKKFNTELTDYSVNHKDNAGPYAQNLEVDALIVGGGFGKLGIPILSSSPPSVSVPNKRFSIAIHSWYLHAQDPSGPGVQGRDLRGGK